MIDDTLKLLQALQQAGATSLPIDHEPSTNTDINNNNNNNNNTNNTNNNDDSSTLENADISQAQKKIKLA
jgi:hypothetical protein